MLDVFCNLDVLYEGLGIGTVNCSFDQNFFFFFIIVGIQPKMLDPDPNHEYGSETLVAGTGIVVFSVSIIITWVLYKAFVL